MLKLLVFTLISAVCCLPRWLGPWIQNVADSRWNGHIRKTFELAKPHFCRNMKSNFCVRAIFSYCHWSRILNPWSGSLHRPFDLGSSHHTLKNFRRSPGFFLFSFLLGGERGWVGSVHLPPWAPPLRAVCWIRMVDMNWRSGPNSWKSYSLQSMALCESRYKLEPETRHASTCWLNWKNMASPKLPLHWSLLAQAMEGMITTGMPAGSPLITVGTSRRKRAWGRLSLTSEIMIREAPYFTNSRNTAATRTRAP